MFVCLGFGHFILFVYFFPWPRSSKGPRMGRQFFKNVDFSVTYSLNPQAPDGVYKPPHVYCRMGFINTLPLPALHLSRNAAIVSESLKISDQCMAKRY